MTEAYFQKFMAIEVGVLGVASLLYGIAALLGWKYARPRRWWDWEPAKRRARHYAPEAFVLAILTLSASRWPFQDHWEPDFSLLAIWFAAAIVSIVISCVGSKKFETLAKEQGMAHTPEPWVRGLNAVFVVLIAISGFFHRIWWLQGLLIQSAIILVLVSLIVDYLAPADQSA